MIERKNIIKLLSDRSNVYHSALLTTYSFDPIFLNLYIFLRCVSWVLQTLWF